MSTLMQDLRFALRSLAHDKALTSMVVICLALGIGANSAIFSVVDGVLLRPLPYRDPAHLAVLWEIGPNFRAPASGPDYLDWQRRSTTFESFAALSPTSGNLTGEGDPERVPLEQVSVNMLGLLGVAPAHGRDFRGEDSRPGGEPVAIIGDGLWRRRFGADLDLMGQTIMLDGRATTVVGILPPAFELPSPWSDGEPDELLIPLPDEDLQTARGDRWLVVLGRIAAGVTYDAAVEEMTAIGTVLATEYPDSNADIAVRVVPLREQLVGGADKQLTMLLIAAGAVLLIACGNAAGLLAARATGRLREVGIRVSLGASRARLVRQLLTEAIPLAALGCAGGVMLAGAGMGVLRSLVPPTIPGATVGVDLRTLVFSVVVASATGILFSLAPAVATLRRGGAMTGVAVAAGASVGRSRLQGTLTVMQVALTLVLANGAALMMSSYLHVTGAEYGFDREGVVTVELSLGGEEYDDAAKVHAFYEQVLPRLAGRAGIDVVAATSKLPLYGGTNTGVTTDAPGVESGQRNPIAELSVVTPGYFDAMGIALVAGRLLRPEDGASGAPGVVVNHALARRLWPGEEAMGKRIRLEGRDWWATVVGVVGDVRQFGLERAAIPEVYLPYLPGQPSSATSFTRVRYIVVRGAGDTARLVDAIRQAVLAVDNDQPLGAVRTMADIYDEGLAGRRLNTMLTLGFAGTAAVLVAAGIFGLMAFFVQRRRREIGIRMALGARHPEVVSLVLLRALRLTMIGIVLGVGGTLASTRIIEGLLYMMDPVDVRIIGGVSLLLVLLSVLSAWLPARRAARVHPTVTLRAE